MSDATSTRSSEDLVIQSDGDRCRLSVRTLNTFDRLNIKTLGDLLNQSAMSLRAARGFGDSSLGEVMIYLATHGFVIERAASWTREWSQPFRARLGGQAPELGSR